ncbi:MAG: cation-transporting P-type ATPase, partial [Candidatus Aminicenantales bacterium]
MTVPLPRGADYWSRPAEQLLSDLGATAQGLGDAEARSRLETVGPNLLKVHKRATALGLFLSQFKSPLVLILVFATFVSALAKD